jgi:hypothetical protein
MANVMSGQNQKKKANDMDDEMMMLPDERPTGPQNHLTVPTAPSAPFLNRQSRSLDAGGVGYNKKSLVDP